MAKSLFPKLYFKISWSFMDITESRDYASKHFPIGSHVSFVHWFLLLFYTEMKKKTIKGFYFATLITFRFFTNV